MGWTAAVKQHQVRLLAHKLFLLSHPDIDDLAKVDLLADVLAAVKSDDMVANDVLESNDTSRGAPPDQI